MMYKILIILIHLMDKLIIYKCIIKQIMIKLILLIQP